MGHQIHFTLDTFAVTTPSRPVMTKATHDENSFRIEWQMEGAGDKYTLSNDPIRNGTCSSTDRKHCEIDITMAAFTVQNLEPGEGNLMFCF